MAREIFLLVVIPAALILVLYRAAVWAIHGDGYWPRGALGVALAALFVLGSPFVLLTFLRGLECKTPMYWVIPPLHDTRAEAFPTK